MAKRRNGFDGVPIKLKRTKSALAQLNDVQKLETTQFGEPIYFDDTDTEKNPKKYLAICDRNPEWSDDYQVKTAGDLKYVFKAYDKDKIEKILLYDTNDAQADAKSQIVTLLDDAGREYYSRLKKFTNRDTNGIPIKRDSLNEEAKMNATGTWYKLDKVTTTTTPPMVQKITIPNMTSSIAPIVQLALSNAQKTPSDSKKYKKSFSTISEVESGEGCIWLYCLAKKPAVSCYIDVFGG